MDDARTPIHPLIEWAARSIVWGRLGVPVSASHATAMERAMNVRLLTERVQRGMDR